MDFHGLKIFLVLSCWTLIAITHAEFIGVGGSGIEWQGNVRISTPSQLRNLRPCFLEGYYEDTSDCRKFYRCVNYGTLDAPLLLRHDFDCPPGTIFDNTYSICNHPLMTKRSSSLQSSCVFPLQLQYLSQFTEYSPVRNSNIKNKDESGNLNSNSQLLSSNLNYNSNSEPDSNSLFSARSNFPGANRQGKSRRLPVIPPLLASSSYYNRVQIPNQYPTSSDQLVYSYGNGNANGNGGNASSKERDEDDDGLLKIKSVAAIQGKFSRRLLEKFHRQQIKASENTTTTMTSLARTREELLQRQQEERRRRIGGGDESESQQVESSETVTSISTQVSGDPPFSNSNKNEDDSSPISKTQSKEGSGQRKNSLFPLRRYQVQIPYLTSK